MINSAGPDMSETQEITESWSGLILLLAVCGVLMLAWFYVFPYVALLCTIAGILICLISLSLSQRKAPPSGRASDAGAPR